MSNIKKGSKLTVSTANGISRASSNNLGVLEVSGPGLANVVSQDSTFSLSSSNVPQFTIGATDNSGIFQLGLDNQGNAVLESTLNGSNKNILIQQLGGYVGIGTTNPASTLHVKSTDAIIIPVGTNTNRPGESGQITAQNGMIRYNTTTSQFEGFGGPGSAWGSLGGVKDVDGDTKIIAETSAGTDNDSLDFFTYGSQRMTIDSSGNVGIGTTSPGAQLHIQPSSVGSRTDPYNDQNNNATKKALIIGDNNTNGVYANLGTSTSGSTLAFGMNWYNSNSPTNVDNVLVLSNVNGKNRVGIGTTDPDSPLEIICTASSVTNNINTQWTDAKGLRITRAQYGYGWEIVNGHHNSLLFRNIHENGTVKTGCEQVLVLKDDGNVGIGTTNPTGGKLHVVGDIYTTGKILGEVGGSKLIVGDATFRNATAPTNGMLVEGKVGIGTTDPGSYRFAVHAGRSQFYNRMNDGVSEGLMVLSTSTNVSGHSASQINISSVPRGYLTTYASIELRGSEQDSQSWRAVNYGCGIRARGGLTDREYADLSIWTTNPSTNAKQDVMSIQSNGNVGIGTTTPNAKLEIKGDSNDYGGIVLSQNSNWSSTPALWNPGTDTSTHDYEIVGRSAGNASYGFLRLMAGGGNAHNSRIELAAYTGNNNGKNIAFFCADAEQMRINNNGVGIHTDAPAFSSLRLKVGGNVYVSGNVGIGTTDPRNKLDVEGAVVIGTSYSGTNTAPTNGMLVEGNVGIGTTDPGGYKLKVQGQIYASNSITSTGFITSVGFTLGGGQLVRWGSSNYGASIMGYENSNLRFYVNNTERMRIDSGGNVGIGTTSPYGKVEISDDWTNNGNAEAKAYLNFSNTNVTYPSRWQIGPWKNGAGSKVFGIRGGGSTTDFTALNSLFTVHYDGYVGINQETNLSMGTGFKLQVNGLGVFCNNGTKANSVSIGDNGIRALIESRSTTHNLEFWVNGSSRLAIKANNGYVGIGNSTPEYLIDLADSTYATATSPYPPAEFIRFNCANTSGNSSGGLIWKTNFGSTYTKISAKIEAICEADSFRQGLAFFTGSFPTSTTTLHTTDATEKMRIDMDGKVGIGTTSPNAKLEIKGDSNDYGGIVLSQNSNWSSTPALWNPGTDTSTHDYEIVGRSAGNASYGFLRLMAGGGNAHNSRIELAAYTGNNNGKNIAFFCADAEQMRINNNGVGIGTTAPETNFHVVGDGQTMILEGATSSSGFCYMGLYPFGFSGGEKGYFGYPYAGWSSLVINNKNDAAIQFWTNNSAKMWINSNGSVGIGTSTVSHSAKLEVKGGPLLVRSDGAGVDTLIQIRGGGGHSGYVRCYSGGRFGLDSYGTAHALTLQASSGGNVGIGTTSPSQKLDILGSGATGTGRIRFTDTDTAANARNWFVGPFRSTDACFAITPSASKGGTTPDLTKTFQISDNGHVGIGTTSPDAKLHIHSSDNTMKMVVPTGNSGYQYQTNFRYGGHHIDIYLSNQTKGFGTSGDEEDMFLNYYSGGGVRLASNVAVTSDDRLKHNEKKITNGLDIINQLEPKKYFKSLKRYDEDHNYDLDSSGNPITDDFYIIETGLIAQKVMTIDDLKYAVDEVEDKYKTVEKEKLDENGDVILDSSGNPIIEKKEEISVKGRYTVKYQDIFVYNIAATRELYKLVVDLQKEITKVQTLQTDLSTANTIIQTHETTIQQQTTKITTLETQIADILTRLSNLENIGSA